MLGFKKHLRYEVIVSIPFIVVTTQLVDRAVDRVQRGS